MKWLKLVLLPLASTAAADHNWEHRDIFRGQRLYAYSCASCHGINLEGQPNWQSPDANAVLPAPPHDGTGHTWHHDDELLFEYTKARWQRGFGSQRRFRVQQRHACLW